MRILKDKCQTCGGTLAVTFFQNQKTKQIEPNYGLCLDCLKEFTITCPISEDEFTKEKL